ncbi:MAG: hypothetical protein U9P14_00575, partial [Gemmatimonadota bacterium]|nr:hypothetical protein [Gemmatimonadota bacterium]
FSAAAKKSARWFYLGSFAAAGLAALTKGPVGLVLPGGIAILFMLTCGRLRQSLRRVPWLAGTLILIVICLPWYLAVNFRSDFEFYRVFILQHNLHRFFGKVDAAGQHVEPFYYYLPVLLAGFYPWSFYTIQAVLAPGARFISGLRKKSLDNPGEVFALIWFAAVIVFFSLSKAKLATYITPAFPPLAILIVDYWARKLNVPLVRKSGWIMAPAALGLAAAVVMAAVAIVKGPDLASFPLGALPLLAGAVFLAGPAAALGLLLRDRASGALAAQVAGQMLLAWLVAFGILPQVSRQSREPHVRLAGKAVDYLGDTGTLAAFRYRKTGLIFYSRHTVRFLEQHEIASLDSLPSPLALVTREKYLQQLLNRSPELTELTRDGGLVLLGR